jgi:hemerythrin superfamily protein
MDNQMIEARQQGNFPSNDPTQGLIQDHEFVKKLMHRYLDTQDMQVKAMAGPQICEALQMHISLEEAVFYPRVRELVDRCETDHERADELITQLQALTPGGEEYDTLMQQLQQTILSHITLEEQQLFPKVRSSSINLQDLALKMKAYESTLVSDHASGGQTRRPGAQH